jgi:hypothetical protein
MLESRQGDPPRDWGWGWGRVSGSAHPVGGERKGVFLQGGPGSLLGTQKEREETGWQGRSLG